MNQRTFNNLQKFLEQVDSTYSGFIDRADLQATLKKVKAGIKGMSADMLRDNEAQRAKFHKAISALTAEIKALPDVETRRAIDF
jgi:septal ring factor EnvC (AmiA/AmiB activator)